MRNRPREREKKKKKGRGTLQYPSHSTMQFSIHTLQILKSNLLLQDDLVETRDEVGIQESAVVDGKTQNSSNKLEVVQMFRIHTRSRVNLQGVIIRRRVLE